MPTTTQTIVTNNAVPTTQEEPETEASANMEIESLDGDMTEDEHAEEEADEAEEVPANLSYKNQKTLKNLAHARDLLNLTERAMATMHNKPTNQYKMEKRRVEALEAKWARTLAGIEKRKTSREARKASNALKKLEEAQRIDKIMPKHLRKHIQSCCTRSAKVAMAAALQHLEANPTPIDDMIKVIEPIAHKAMSEADFRPADKGGAKPAAAE